MIADWHADAHRRGHGVNAGIGGNVLANTITSMGQGVPGVDTVTNSAAFTMASMQRADTAFKARFVLYHRGAFEGTLEAIESAIADVQQGLQDTITENYDYNGTYDPGFFYVVVDDGSARRRVSLLNAIGNAIEDTRALGIRFAVFAPVVTTANVSMTITSAVGLGSSDGCWAPLVSRSRRSSTSRPR